MHRSMWILARTAFVLAICPAGVAGIDLRAPVNYLTPAHPSGVAAGDFDQDGDIDLAVTTRGPSSVDVLRNKGDGTFSGPAKYTIKGGPDVGHVVAADVDADGDLDLAVALTTTNTVLVMINSDGAFSAGASAVVGGMPIWIEAAMLDADEDLDLVVVTKESVCTLFNDGHGVFEPVTIDMGGDLRVAVPIDADGDGDLDVAVTDHADASIRILGNDGDGGFAPMATVESPGMRPEGIVAADLDGDGDPDLAITAGPFKWGYVLVFFNDGGGFSGSGEFVTNSLDPTTIGAADLDADGDIDLVTTNEDSGDISVLANNGNGEFGAPIVITTGKHAERMAFADYDSNGGLDVVVVNRNVDTTSVMLNNADGVWCAADLSGDGVADLMDFLAFVNLFNAGESGADFNGDGALDLTDFLAFINVFLNC